MRLTRYSYSYSYSYSQWNDAEHKLLCLSLSVRRTDGCGESSSDSDVTVTEYLSITLSLRLLSTSAVCCIAASTLPLLLLLTLNTDYSPSAIVSTRQTSATFRLAPQMNSMKINFSPIGHPLTLYWLKGATVYNSKHRLLFRWIHSAIVNFLVKRPIGLVIKLEYCFIAAKVADIMWCLRWTV